MPRYERRRQRRTHCQGSQAFQDIAFLEDNGTWPLFRKPCIRSSVFHLAQDNWRDIDAYCPLFTGVCDESHSNGTRTAADIEDAVRLFDLWQQKSSLRLSCAGLLGCKSLAPISLVIVIHLARTRIAN